MRAQIVARLAGSRLPADVSREAAARVEPQLLQAWFKQPLRPAAVLIPLVERPDGLQMILTERTHTVSDHPGQVAFPGGMAEDQDSDLEATALRETDEEVGIAPALVEIAGYLEPQAVISGYAVLPAVGFVDPDYEPRLDPREVAALFEVPLDFLLDDANRIRIDRERNGVVLPAYEYHHGGHRIWGATALMIRSFINCIKNK